MSTNYFSNYLPGIIFKALTILAIPLALTNAANAEMSAGCEVQIARANLERLQYVPTIKQEKVIKLNPVNDLVSEGSISYDVEADREGARAYQIIISITLNKTDLFGCLMAHEFPPSRNFYPRTERSYLLSTVTQTYSIHQTC